MEGVYADKHNVIVLEEEFYHLLRMTVDICLHQATEFCNSVVYVNNIITCLNLLEFLKTQGKLAPTGAITFQIIFVEAVEYLVVGEEAYLLLVVGEAFVDGMVYGGETYLIATVFENILQSLVLIRCVAKY